MTAPAGIPPQAIEDAMAAASAADRAWVQSPGRERGGSHGGISKTQLRRLIEAAAPHLAAAEREACAQLAEQVRAHYGCYVGIEAASASVVTSGLRPFAALLREAQ